MRKRGVVLVLLACACGSSNHPTDSAVSEDSIRSDRPVVSTGDPDPCAYAAGHDLPTDVTSCMPAQGTGVVYELNLGVDAGSCASRPAVSCNGTCGAGPTLFIQIEGLVAGCLTSESTFVVTFSQGCADHLYLQTPYSDPGSIAACVAAALNGSHFACAEQVPCWQWSESTLLPVAP
jgi:hypothetical protein